MLRKLLILLVTPLLAACATGASLSGSGLPTGTEAYSVMSSPEAVAVPAEYRISPFDQLSINVFQEPDLSTPANAPLQVDASGNINMPLLGTVSAGGMTTAQLGSLIAAKLSGRYLRNPQVTVAVASTAPEKVTVQGEVTQPGMYDIKGKTTLLQAIALARGETRLAATNEVAVFRTVNGQRLGALFNLDEIRRGRAPDTALMPNDIVIVGHSRSKEAWQNFLSVNPMMGVFRAVSGMAQ
jgi:polysaccharide export outer membrane protein